MLADDIPDSTRAAYDLVAENYADLLRHELDNRPLERAILSAFAEAVTADGPGPVLEVGCGPGRITAQLRELGLAVSGMDLSPGMIAVARRDHPQITFSVGTMYRLDVPDGELAGLVGWYSIIHIPPARRAEVFAEFARAVRGGGRLLLAFQVGDEKRHITEGYGHPVSLEAYRLVPEHVEELLERAGFTVEARMVRAPRPPEKVPQAYVVAVRQ